MSGPFIYSPPHQDYFPPPGSAASYWGCPYQSPPVSTPFLPNESVFSPSFSGTPNTPERPFPSALGWSGARSRRRRGSWNGGSAPRVSPFIPPPPLPAFVERRRSWSNANSGWHSPNTLPPSPYPPFPSQLHSNPQPLPFSAPPYPHHHHHQYPHFSAPPYSAPLPYVSGYPQFPGPLEIHPWINGEAPSPEFFFDLSVTDFLPCRMLGEHGAVRLTHADLAQPAFYPPITRLRIVCDMILQWPIDLVFGGGGGGMSFAGMGQPPPITLGDILIAVHQKMHQPITHLDWSRLSMGEETVVSRAFTRRCRRESAREGAMVHFEEEMPERQKGVKVVDFLRGRNIFRGLVRGADGSVKLAVSEQ
ncbi:hypothetical protein B0H16DRAFT_1493805 [Mycena metata]|uniref:DUF6699 domain-containing protein n=1 Tax=Mycena metata TaxID=1033252 RepID=A0AAD7P0H3_9AGAR|nr:hypothetical protein B0H16DRAFT_1493805 [Mycena metata]